MKLTTSRKKYCFALPVLICVFTASAFAGWCPSADLNGNCWVNIYDLEIFADEWLNAESCEETSTCADFDGLNGVDFADFAVLANQWQTHGSMLFINEFMASNNSASGFHDPNGNYDDWIEIYNLGDTPVNMAGMYLTDNLTSPTKFHIPTGYSSQTTIPARGFLIFWADDETTQGPLHTNFKLSADGEEIGLYDTDGVTQIDAVVFGAQTTNVSYGRCPDGTGDWYNMSTPTPGATNQAGMAGEVLFSKPSGTFTSTFNLLLATESPTAQIRYTANGSLPTAGSTLYTGPIAISTSATTKIRARVFDPAAGLAPGPVTSHCYIPLAVDAQGFTSNLPIVIIDTAGFDIDTENDPYIAWPFRNVYTAFIDTNSAGRAKVTDSADFAGRGGLKVRGDSSAADWVAANWAKQYAFETWDDYNDNLNVSILGFPSESKWILHVPFDDKTLMRNVLAYKWSNAMGNYASRTKYVELFLNKNGDNVSMSDYWGVYILMEKIKIDDSRVDIAKLGPADNNEPEVTGGYIIKHDKNSLGDPTFTTTQNKTGAFQYQDPVADELTTQQKAWIKGYLDAFEAALYGGSYTDPVNGYAKYIDVNTFVDFHWMVEITKQVDAYVYSAYMYKDRNGKLKMGPAWDFNLGFGNAYGPSPGWPDPWYYDESLRSCQGWYYSGAGEINVWYNRLRTDAEYNLKCADRWFELREGPLSDANVLADIDYYYNLLSAEAAARHFNRWQLYVNPATGMEVGSGGVWASILNAWTWPNYYYGTPNNPHTYLMEVNWMKTWMAGNGTSPGLYSDRLYWIDNNIGYAFPPNFTVGGVPMNTGGNINVGSSLTITAATPGTIYYTLNGTDPRQTFTGNAVGTAYSGPITLNTTTQVKARIKNGSSWSALNKAVFSDNQVANSLRITEIMYHPLDTNNPNDPNKEYIELKNIGSNTINLNLVTFDKGIDFTFGPNTLAAGQHILVVKDQNAFAAKYGTGRYIAGQYTGSLDNGGERLRLLDAVGGTILDFNYNDNWRNITDGDGYSLTIINPSDSDLNDWGKKDSWRASAYINGSPGWDDSNIVPNPGAIAINEVMAHSHDVASDWIELKNTTTNAIDISGWYLSDSDSNLMKYRFATGVNIPANGYLVVYESNNFGATSSDPGRLIPFALSENGESVCLTSALDANSNFTGYREKEDFGASDTNVAFGRYYKASTGTYNFVPMSTNTPGSANFYPKVGPIIVTEIMYHPDWPTTGSYANDEYEFIELRNTSVAAVTLYDSNENLPWKFTNGIDYTFASPPSAVTIAAGARILVVKNPTAFNARYPGLSSITYGPYSGWLANDGEQLELSKPGDVDNLGVRHYIRVERVDYSDGSHPGSEPGDVDLWPTGADGLGKSLIRTSTTQYGNDPNNWTAATPTPGS